MTQVRCNRGFRPSLPWLRIWGQRGQPQEMPLKNGACIHLTRGCKVGLNRRYSCAFAFILPLVYWTFVSFGPSQARAQDPVVSIEPRAGSRPNATGSADRAATNIRVNSDLVLIPVMVTDRHDTRIRSNAEAAAGKPHADQELVSRPRR